MSVQAYRGVALVQRPSASQAEVVRQRPVPTRLTPVAARHVDREVAKDSAWIAGGLAVGAGLGFGIGAAMSIFGGSAMFGPAIVVTLALGVVGLAVGVWKAAHA